MLLIINEEYEEAHASMWLDLYMSTWQGIAAAIFGYEWMVHQLDVYNEDNMMEKQNDFCIVGDNDSFMSK